MFQETINVRIKKLNKLAVIPKYAKLGDAGMDVVATSVDYDENLDCYVYHTGLAFEVPEGYVMSIYPRSSNRKTDAYLCNSVGILDSGYRGELMICYKNRTSMKAMHSMSLYTNEPLLYAPYNVGDRIAQIIITPYPNVKFQEVDELSDTERGKGGFGSTGK